MIEVLGRLLARIAIAVVGLRTMYEEVLRISASAGVTVTIAMAPDEEGPADDEDGWPGPYRGLVD